MKKRTLSAQNKNQLYSLLAKNAYHTRAPHVKSTGFRMSSLCYSERENLYNIAEDYLINSYLKRNDPEVETSISAYLQDEGMKLVSLLGQEDLSAFKTIELTQGAPLDMPLGDALSRRRSVRDFTGDAISFENLATLLRAANGVSAIADVNLINGDVAQFHLRTMPSGGGLYPIDLYFAARTINGMSPGIYRYQAIEDKLVVIGDENKMYELLQAFNGLVDLVQTSNASMVMFYIARPWRTMRKYGHRGLRFVFQEVGAIAQNLHLAATTLGLGSVDCASFYEDEAHRALGFDGICQAVIHTTLIGSIA